MTETNERTIAKLDIEALEPGPALNPHEAISPSEATFWQTWDTPLAPWGAFKHGSNAARRDDDGRPVLSFERPENKNVSDRAIVTRETDLRDLRIRAEVKQLEEAARQDYDSRFPMAALAGVVFRWETSRRYYFFGIEGKRRLVLYRRRDEEWFALATKEVAIPDGYVDLEIEADGDAIRCRSTALDAEFFVTDTDLKTGRAGYRSLQSSKLASLEITETPSAARRREARARTARFEETKRGEGIPDAVLARTYDLEELGGAPIFHDFIEPGRFDMLIHATDGLTARSPDGEVIWKSDAVLGGGGFPGVLSRDGDLYYGFAGSRPTGPNIQDEMVVVRTSDGEVMAREKLPSETETMRFFGYGPRGAAFSDDKGTDVVLREWDDRGGGGGFRLFAYDRSLKPLWEAEQTSAHYGHHWALAFMDVTGDGKDELLAGGLMYDAAGNVVWTHDRVDEMMETYGGVHYDAVALGNYTLDEDDAPVAFLFGGTAGVYVVDGLTGETRAIHRTGHAQGRNIGKVRGDIPGEQILGVTRWGNYGILTLFSGRGEKLWEMQPDFIGQGACPVRWPGSDVQLIWTSTTREAQAFYDGYGRRVKVLTALADAWGDRMPKVVGRSSGPVRIGTDGWEYLPLTLDGVLHAFGPDGC